MTTLTAGANAPLTTDKVVVEVSWSPPGSTLAIDVSAFALTSDGKVRGDKDMVFFNQPKLGDGGVLMSSSSESTRFEIDTGAMADTIEKLAFTATIDSASAGFARLSAARVQVLDARGSEHIAFHLPLEGRHEAALILAEVYRRQGQWKFRAVGQGFNGGLKPLAEHFGVDVAAETAHSPQKAAEASSVNLSKVSLTKEKPSISLNKKGGSFGQLEINLNWNQLKKKGAFFGIGGGSKAVDLDLCCLYTLADGFSLGVQALGNKFGSFDSPPFIQLYGDDRSGAVSDGEWMRINGAQWGKIRRVLVFAMIYEGVPNWSGTDGIVTIFAPGQPDIEVRLEGTGSEPICAVAMLENNGGGLTIMRENRYFHGAPDMDRHYGFGLNWTAGKK